MKYDDTRAVGKIELVDLKPTRVVAVRFHGASARCSNPERGQRDGDARSRRPGQAEIGRCRSFWNLDLIAACSGLLRHNFDYEVT